jgi:hypothetical protein
MPYFLHANPMISKSLSSNLMLIEVQDRFSNLRVFLAESRNRSAIHAMFEYVQFSYVM